MSDAAFHMLADPPAELLTLADRVRNWGRWGEDDECGTLNYITAAKRAAAARLVRRGDVFALAIPFDHSGPQVGAIGRVNPLHMMTATGVDATQAMDLGGGARYTDDAIVMPLQCATQWDSLAHVFYDGHLYNGRPASTVDARGASHNGVDRTHDRYISRGVVLDVARAKGVSCLPLDYAITPEDLDAVEATQGVSVGEGDFLLVRTGLMSTWRETGTWASFHGLQPGLHYRCAEWLFDRRAAAVAADNAAVEHLGLSVPGVMLPFHMLAIRDMGLSLGEYWMLEDLAADCAADGTWECMVTAPALPISGAVGSPVNPIALK